MTFITGIQQAGIGVTDAAEAKYLYRELFGMDVLIFDDQASATLMKGYTGATIHERRAILSMNLSGGGGFEIWQYTSRQPSKPLNGLRLGDLGIYAVKIKSRDVAAAHAHFSGYASLKISPVFVAPDDRPHFWIIDPYGNHFEIVEGDEWFKRGKKICGGVVGAVIGVSNMQRSVSFYRDTLGINEIIYSGKAPMIDTAPGEQAANRFHRVLLKKEMSHKGAFSRLLGATQIELFQSLDREGLPIFGDRFWGDCGFIHLCFDVINMDGLKEKSASGGYPFSVDSSSGFAMGEAAGRFCYVEDPDKTLIELVETHKVPVLKKLGLYIDLKKRKNDRPLPHWLISLLGLNKIH